MNLRISLILLGLAGLACEHAQSPTPPDAPPGQLAAELLNFCEAPQLDALTQWLKQHSAPTVPPAAIDFVGRDITERCGLDGGWRLQAVTSGPGPLQLSLVGRKSGIAYQMRLATTPDGKLVGIGLQPSIPTEESIAKDLSDAASFRHGIFT